MRNDRTAVEDILSAIEAIERHRVASPQELAEQELIQSHYIRFLSVIGEAANRTSSQLRKDYPSVPWRDLVGMRNILVHDYEDIDLEEVWRTVSTDLPELRAAVQRILQDLET